MLTEVLPVLLSQFQMKSVRQRNSCHDNRTDHTLASTADPRFLEDFERLLPVFELALPDILISPRTELTVEIHEKKPGAH